MKLCLLTVLASSLLAWQGKAAAAGPPGKSALEGEWAVAVWDFNGFWFTAVDGQIGDHYRDLRFTFTAKRVTIKLREKGQSLGWWGLDGVESAYKIDPTKDPKQIDFDFDSFFGFGIYALRGDRLVLCLACGEGKKRPETFELTPKGADTLILLERVKERRK